MSGFVAMSKRQNNRQSKRPETRMAMHRLRLACAAALAFALPATAQGVCKDMSFEGQSFSVCTATAGQDVRIFHTDAAGALLGSFGNVNTSLAAEGKSLLFAMNAGMYHPDRAPVGLLVTEGEEQARIVTREGPGNFGLLPNGVFCIGDEFGVIESRAYAATPPACRFATQSGPMLVKDGALHPRFLENSDSRYIRNGVGVSADGKTAFFAISSAPVNFHLFGRLFRDALNTPNALYFDGKISRLFSTELRRNDFGFSMGPIVALVVPN
jgi:uncharacterized protein YigE (DUF2233 family)